MVMSGLLQPCAQMCLYFLALFYFLLALVYCWVVQLKLVQTHAPLSPFDFPFFFFVRCKDCERQILPSAEDYLLKHIWCNCEVVEQLYTIIN